MNFPALQNALSTYFGDDSEIESVEDESEAWSSITMDYGDGIYEGMLDEIKRLLLESDKTIFDFLRSVAPAWSCDSFSDARHSLQVFLSYVETYTSQDG